MKPDVIDSIRHNCFVAQASRPVQKESRKWVEGKMCSTNEYNICMEQLVGCYPVKLGLGKRINMLNA